MADRATRGYVGLVLDVLAGLRVTVEVNRATMTIRYRPGWVPVVGRTCRVERSRGRWVATGPISSSEVVIPAGGDVPPLPGNGTHGPVRPIWCGTWTGARWVPGELVLGDRLGVAQVGAVWFGAGAAVRLRGPVTEARLRLRGAVDSYGQVSLAPITDPARPAGAPDAAAAVATADLLGRDPVDVVLPGIGAGLVAGTYRGIKITAPGASRLTVSTDLDSLTLTMDWST